MIRPQSCTARYLSDAHAAELGVDFDLARSARRRCCAPARRTVGLGVADADAARSSPAGMPFLGDLLLEIARRFDDRVAGHDRRPAARLADRIRAAIRVAPDDVDLRQRHAERFRRNQPHRRLRAARRRRSRRRARRSGPSRSRRITALLRPSPARNARNATPTPRLIGPASDRRPRTPALLPLEGLGAAADALLERVVGVRRLVARLPRHVLEDEVDRIHLQLARRRRPSSTGCRRSPAETRGRGSSPTRSCSCRRERPCVSMFGH